MEDVIDLRSRQISCSALVDNLFATWVPFGLRRWRAHPRLETSLDFLGEHGEWWHIFADDLPIILETAERQWFNVPSTSDGDR